MRLRQEASLAAAVIFGCTVVSACNAKTGAPNTQAGSEPLPSESASSESTVQGDSTLSSNTGLNASADGAETPTELRERGTTAIESGDWLGLAKLTVPEERAFVAAFALVIARGLFPAVRKGLERTLSEAKATRQLSGSAATAADSELSRYDQAVKDMDAMIAETWTSLETLTQLLQQVAVGELNQRFPDPVATLSRLAEIQKSVGGNHKIELLEFDMNAPLANAGTELHAPVAWGDGYVLMTKLSGRWYMSLLASQPGSLPSFETSKATLNRQSQQDLEKLERAAKGRWQAQAGSISFYPDGKARAEFRVEVQPGDEQPRTSNVHEGELDLTEPHTLGIRDGAMTVFIGAYVDHRGKLHAGYGTASAVSPERAALIPLGGAHSLQVQGNCRLLGKPNVKGSNLMPCRFRDDLTPPRFEFEIPAGVIDTGKVQKSLIYLKEEGLLVSETLWETAFDRVKM